MRPGLRIRILTVALLATLLATTMVACQGGSQPAPPPPPDNQPPVAEIGYISPSQPYAGEEVILHGQGIHSCQKSFSTVS